MNLGADVLAHPCRGVSSFMKENETGKLEWWGHKHNNEVIMGEQIFNRDITATVSDGCLPD